MAKTEVVLFDLGGVLVELGGVPVLREWAQIESDQDVWARWLRCPWVRRYERGQCTRDEFANGLVDDVITRLTRIPGLHVAARGDSFTLAPNTASREVRARLRVRAVVATAALSAYALLRTSKGKPR